MFDYLLDGKLMSEKRLFGVVLITLGSILIKTNKAATRADEKERNDKDK